MGKVFFFGYGANKDPNRLKEIIGKYPEGGQGAIVNGYNLAVQNLSQIPAEARQILRKVWGDNFHAYTLKAGSGYVEGRVWLIDEEDLKKLEQWEFVGEKNWREFVTVSASDSEGKSIPVVTEKSHEHLAVEQLTDGINYETNLNKEGRQWFSKDDERKMELLRSEIRRYYGASFIIG